ncbi:efflux RND transporter periplasmic adaptor subunit [Immundisolibacter sp.]|uniref:efflux RND transporter periplasmic adaptor subunit n=1 Tax=Immundisolibacter sp. TaxID=1934948 RepID=UPI0035646189
MPALRPFFATAVAVFVCVVALAACGKTEEPRVKPPVVLITAAVAGTAAMETLETSVGQIESMDEPVVSAEVAGRVVAVNVEVGARVRKGQALVELDSKDYRLRQGSAQAELARLAALIAQQERLVGRYETLAKSDFFAKNAVEDARAQLTALHSQREAAVAQDAEARHNLQRGRIVAPLDAAVAARMVDVGDYVAVGMPIVRLSTDQMLRVTLPYPESLADALRPGLPVRLRSPAAPDTTVEANITEIRPTVGMSNLALQVMVDLPNPGGWKPGSSVNGEVILGRRERAVVVPEKAVVLRPSGSTVYIIEDDRARAAKVQTGTYRDGLVEIVSGVPVGAKVALDGAGFLSDGALVRVQDGGS